MTIKQILCTLIMHVFTGTDTGGVDRVASHPPQCSPKFKEACLLIECSNKCNIQLLKRSIHDSWLLSKRTLGKHILGFFRMKLSDILLVFRA